MSPVAGLVLIVVNTVTVSVEIFQFSVIAVTIAVINSATLELVI